MQLLRLLADDSRSVNVVNVKSELSRSFEAIVSCCESVIHSVQQKTGTVGFMSLGDTCWERTSYLTLSETNLRFSSVCDNLLRWTHIPSESPEFVGLGANLPYRCALRLQLLQGDGGSVGELNHERTKRPNGLLM